MGMSKAQCEKVCDLKLVKPYVYIFETEKVPNPHYAFEKFLLFITPTQGLYKLRAIGDTISTSQDGNEIKLKFNELKKVLKNVYSDHRLVDELKPESKYKDPDDWMEALLYDDRSLYAVWRSKYNSKLKNNIDILVLEANPHGIGYSFISLDYFFSNYDDALKEIEKRRQDVF